MYKRGRDRERRMPKVNEREKEEEKESDVTLYTGNDDDMIYLTKWRQWTIG